MYFVGDGAERVEEYLREQFPKARIARLDRDTVRTKREYQQVLGAFAQGEIDVLVGTQMVAKGHDFQRVTLVGVVAADLALGRPDFRAAERTFQLLTQVAGRAGRGELSGEVLVETYYPEHYAIQYAVAAGLHFVLRKGSALPAHAALSAVHRAGQRAGARPQKSRTPFAGRARWRLFRAVRRTRSEDSRPGRRAARAPAPRIPISIRAEVAAPRARWARPSAAAWIFAPSKEIPETAVIVDVDPTSLS